MASDFASMQGVTDPAEETKNVLAHSQSAGKTAYSLHDQSAAKSYAFAFAGAGRAELRITGEYSKEDLEDLETYLEVAMRGLKRSKERSA